MRDTDRILSKANSSRLPSADTGATMAWSVAFPPALVDAIADALHERLSPGAGTAWMDVPEAAAYLGQTEAALRKAAQRGQVPAYQPFGPRTRYFFDPRELDDWVRGNVGLATERAAA